MKKLILSFFLICNVIAFSQNPLIPVIWNATYADKGNNEGEITFTATIAENWHIYSQRPTTDGPIPTSFTITSNETNFNVLGKVEEQDAHEEYVKAFEAKVFVFENQAIFKQKIKRKNSKAFTVNTYLEFMTCNDIQCLPPKTIEITVSVPAVILRSKL